MEGKKEERKEIRREGRKGRQKEGGKKGRKDRWKEGRKKEREEGQMEGRTEGKKVGRKRIHDPASGPDCTPQRAVSGLQAACLTPLL